MAANSMQVKVLLAVVVLFIALFLLGCITQQPQQGNKTNQTNQTSETNLTQAFSPPAASSRPHVTTPSPYPTALPSITPAPFLECTKDSDCITSGCSGEICAKKRYYTVCIYKLEFECLKLTTCGCNNGTCGWKPNDAYKQCLKMKTQIS